MWPQLRDPTLPPATVATVATVRSPNWLGLAGAGWLVCLVLIAVRRLPKVSGVVVCSLDLLPIQLYLCYSW
jgi:hypothetical protein